MGISAIGDQARAFAMHASSTRIKTTLSILTGELASGEVADLGARLNGNTQGIVDIEAKLTRLNQLKTSATELATHTAGMNTALDSIREFSSSLVLNLVVEPLGESDSIVKARVAEVSGAFDTAVARLNTSIGQRHLFSGINSDQPPLIPAKQILDELQALTAGMTTAADITASVSAWFDAAPGAGGFLDVAYQGSLHATPTVQVGDASKITLDITAGSEVIREQLKGLAMGALLARGVLDSDYREKRAVLKAAGTVLMNNTSAFADEIGGIGYIQQTIERAQTEGGASIAVYETMRNELRLADPYQTAAAITEAETQLDTLYAVTARLSKLKLVDYLR